MIELLAPAGSREALTAAIENGADAVYLAGNLFGARAYADNFDRENLREAIQFAHLRGVAIHITVNTIVGDNEMEELADYLRFLYEAGADAIVIEDMMASLDMISPKAYRELAAPYEKQLISFINKRVPVIIHICGKLDQVILDVAATGADAISVESAVDVREAKTKFKENGISTPIFGAVHPISALLEGTEEDVAQGVKKSIADGVDAVSPDCAVAPDTPIKNIIAMVKAVEGL